MPPERKRGGGGEKSSQCYFLSFLPKAMHTQKILQFINENENEASKSSQAAAKELLIAATSFMKEELKYLAKE